MVRSNENKIQLKTTIVTELLICFLIGAVPIILAATFQKGWNVIKALAQINPGDTIVLYFVYLFIVNLIAFVINKKLIHPNDEVSEVLGYIHKFTDRLGFAIHGIYRIIVGALPTSVVYILIDNGLSKGWQVVTLLTCILTLGSFIACVFLSIVSDSMQPA